MDFLGRPYPMQQQAASSSSSSVQPHPEAEGADAAAVAPIGTDARLPLLNGQPDMDSREQINEALMTGVRVRHGAGVWCTGDLKEASTHTACLGEAAADRACAALSTNRLPHAGSDQILYILSPDCRLRSPGCLPLPRRRWTS